MSTPETEENLMNGNKKGNHEGKLVGSKNPYGLNLDTIKVIGAGGPDKMPPSPPLINLNFPDAKTEKWRLGRIKYGEKFSGHPIAHAYEELADFSNYMDEALKQKLITASQWADYEECIRVLVTNIRKVWQELEMKRRMAAGEVKPV